MHSITELSLRTVAEVRRISSEKQTFYLGGPLIEDCKRINGRTGLIIEGELRRQTSYDIIISAVCCSKLLRQSTSTSHASALVYPGDCLRVALHLQQHPLYRRASSVVSDCLRSQVSLLKGYSARLVSAQFADADSSIELDFQNLFQTNERYLSFLNGKKGNLRDWDESDSLYQAMNYPDKACLLTLLNIALRSLPHIGKSMDLRSLESVSCLLAELFLSVNELQNWRQRLLHDEPGFIVSKIHNRFNGDADFADICKFVYCTDACTDLLSPISKKQDTIRAFFDESLGMNARDISFILSPISEAVSQFDMYRDFMSSY